MSERFLNKGFTLLELLFVIVIATIISSIVLISFYKINSSQALEKSADLVASVLNEARSQTLSAKGDTQYGVYLEPTQITLFKGDTYSSSDPNHSCGWRVKRGV
jgi:prepilin-type N-terminal cleavage/methylation domain-containing protein